MVILYLVKLSFYRYSIRYDSYHYNNLIITSMKKLFTTFIASILLGIPAMSQGDSVVSLIFTEWSGNHPNTMYFELTNVGDSALHLSNFRVSYVPSWGQWVDWSTNPPIVNSNEPAKWGTRLNGILEPGESILVNNVFDSPGGDDPNSDDLRRWSWNKPEFTQHPHYLPVHYPEPADYEFWHKPGLEMWGKDSVDVYEWLCWAWDGGGATVLYYIYPDGDSVIVDGVNFEKAAASDGLYGKTDVAGVTDATDEHILVRKASITKGNWDWSQARGVDLTDSEWIPIHAYNVSTPGGRRARPYTTVGTHGDFSIELSSETIAIDDGASTLTVPWGIRKNDSILNEFTIGPGMAWAYTEDSLDFADSAYSTVQDGDILRFMACGNDFEMKDYTIQVDDPANNIAMVFPKRRMRFEAMEEEDFNGQMWGGEPYYVTENMPGMDTIGNVPFATRIDTLFKYLEKAPDATWEIEFVDGLERVDVKDGDKLIVTAEDGTTTKEYYIFVLGYEESENAKLGAITWPDIPYYLEGWKGDTIPLFSPTSTAYQVTLPYGTSRVPALVAHRQDFNAMVTVNRATNLSGSQAQRTTTFVVTAEDGVTVLEYSVLFTVEKPPEYLQLFDAEPFISEVVAGKRDYYEFANVGDLPLDMSRYLFVHTSAGRNPADAISAIGSDPSLWGFITRYGFGYVPGYKFSDDTLTWQANPAKLYFDAAVDPVVDPGDVFVLGNPIATQWVDLDAIDQCDVITSYGLQWTTVLDTNFNTWGQVNLNNQVQMHMHWQALYLFHIDNDSILDGTKPVSADPADFTLIDMIGDPAMTDWMTYPIGNHVRGPSWNTVTSFRRQPFIYEGNPEADSASNRDEWLSNAKDDEGMNTGLVLDWLGSHSFDPVTAHRSTITSSVYLVSEGYESPQTIQGDFTGTTIETFLSNIDLADPGQDTTFVGTGNLVATDDTLIVVSANGQNTTKYAILSQPLSDNALITLVNDPSNLSIEVDGENGLIKGVAYNALLKQYIDSLVMPDLATVAIIDQKGHPIPMQQLNYDTVMVDTRIGDNVFIEVVAQDGVTKVNYRFDPASASSDAFVISTIYEVDQEALTISDIAMGTGTVLFWDNIEVVRGATATLLDKAGFERLTGTMSYDDKLQVVSEDGTVKVFYYLNFLDEMNPDGNMPPTVALAFADSTIEGVMEIDVSATAEDDGEPFGSILTYKWEVIEGEAGNVTFADDAALSTTVTFSDYGTYTLRFSASDGELVTTGDVIIRVTHGVGIEDAAAKSVRLYPNPAGDKVTIELVNFENGRSIVTIYNMTGMAVFEDQLLTEKTVLDLELGSGLYVIKITGSEQTFTKQLRIIK